LKAATAEVKVDPVLTSGFWVIPIPCVSEKKSKKKKDVYIVSAKGKFHLFTCIKNGNKEIFNSIEWN
jgi:hypothetical protein